MNADVPSNIRREGPAAVAMYERLLSAGYGHKWAEMCTLQQPPGTKGTDRALMQGRLNEEWLGEMAPDTAKHMLSEAKAAGINTSGKYYMGGLADKRAHRDPAAWVDSAGDILKVAKQRNLTVSGVIDHKGEPQAPPKPKRLNARLTREMMDVERTVHPGRKISDGDLKELVKEKYGRKHKR
jgi:hypothetical protein